jgi:hypothetical protein
MNTNKSNCNACNGTGNCPRCHGTGKDPDSIKALAPMQKMQWFRKVPRM